MLFAGRPELPLPPAPETRTVAVLRWSAAFLVSGMSVLAAGIAALVASDADAGSALLPFAPFMVFPVFLLIVLLAAFSDARTEAEQRYWTPERLRQMQPVLWQVYCAGNGDAPILGRRSRTTAR